MTTILSPRDRVLPHLPPGLMRMYQVKDEAAELARLLAIETAAKAVISARHTTGFLSAVDKLEAVLKAGKK